MAWWRSHSSHRQEVAGQRNQQPASSSLSHREGSEHKPHPTKDRRHLWLFGWYRNVSKLTAEDKTGMWSGSQTPQQILQAAGFLRNMSGVCGIVGNSQKSHLHSCPTLIPPVLPTPSILPSLGWFWTFRSLAGQEPPCSY